MNASNREIIEKWGFWLTLYAIASVVLVLLVSTLLPTSSYSLHIVAALILFPCLLGGISFLYFGAKFRSAIYMCVGVSALFPVALLGLDVLSLGVVFERRITAILFFVAFCLLVSRRGKMDSKKIQEIEKWGHRLASFTICVPFLACWLYLLARIFLTIFPFDLLLLLMIPCVIGGMFYLFIGAKQRSFKYASVGLATVLVAFLNFGLLIDLSFSFFD